MTLQLSYTGKLDIVTCWCGMPHAIPVELHDYQLRKWNDGQEFGIHCPLGHSYIPVGKGKWEYEKAARERAEAREVHLRDQLETSERSKAAIKGAQTKLKKRIAKGVCPCCKRSFVDVARHMEGQHPSFPDK